jgi:hypothetical protein
VVECYGPLAKSSENGFNLTDCVFSIHGELEMEMFSAVLSLVKRVALENLTFKPTVIMLETRDPNKQAN